MKTLTVTRKGKVHNVLLDDDDYEWAKEYYWQAVVNRRNDELYIYRSRLMSDTKGSSKIAMHREIMDRAGHFDLTEQHKQIDHLNLNTLDNRKSNLRVCNFSGNSTNRRKQNGNFTSEYKGVCWYKTKGMYRSYIRCNGKRQYLGYYDSERYAALVYNVYALMYFGDYARLNNAAFSVNIG